MKSIPRFWILFSAGAVLAGLLAQDKKRDDLTPGEIIEKHITAVGGRAALESVKTMMFRGRNSGLGPEDRPLVRYYKQPNLLRQESPGGSSFVASDGQKVYEVSRAGKTEVVQGWASALRHTTIDNDFLRGTKGDIRYEYLGLESIKTGPWTFHRLKRTFPDGYAEDLYFETESGLLRMVVEDNGRAKRIFFEYRDVGGILYPHLMVTVFEGREPPHIFVTDQVKLNPELDDDFFTKSK